MGWRESVCLLALVANLASGARALGQNSGSAVFAANCSGCHGADGRGGEHAPNIASASAIQQRSDRELAGIVHNGVAGAGMPAFPNLKPEATAEVIGYLRILQGRGGTVTLPGDPEQGRVLFVGKGQCAECHMVNGKGGFIGSDLSYYGAGAKPDAIRAVMMDPERALPADKKAITVVTRKGETVTGMLRVNDNFNLSIQSLDGAFHFIPRADLAKSEFERRSLMPAATALNSKEVDDLVSYLLQTGMENSKHSPHALKSNDDDD